MVGVGANGWGLEKKSGKRIVKKNKKKFFQKMRAFLNKKKKVPSRDVEASCHAWWGGVGG